jgi:hypothetical protein
VPITGTGVVTVIVDNIAAPAFNPASGAVSQPSRVVVQFGSVFGVVRRVLYADAARSAYEVEFADALPSTGVMQCSVRVQPDVASAQVNGCLSFRVPRVCLSASTHKLPLKRHMFLTFTHANYNQVSSALFEVDVYDSRITMSCLTGGCQSPEKGGVPFELQVTNLLLTPTSMERTRCRSAYVQCAMSCVLHISRFMMDEVKVVWWSERMIVCTHIFLLLGNAYVSSLCGFLCMRQAGCEALYFAPTDPKFNKKHQYTRKIPTHVRPCFVQIRRNGCARDAGANRLVDKHQCLVCYSAGFHVPELRVVRRVCRCPTQTRE